METVNSDEDSDEESVESTQNPSGRESRFQATMEALADKCALHDASADKKIQDLMRKLDLTTLTEKDFVRDLGHKITSARADCSCKVVMGLTYLFCSEKKKLISHESVKTLRRAARTIKKFRKVKTKVLAPESGWLRAEKDH